jgi:hypothetical protein
MPRCGLPPQQKHVSLSEIPFSVKASVNETSSAVTLSNGYTDEGLVGWLVGWQHCIGTHSLRQV